MRDLLDVLHPLCKNGPLSQREHLHELRADLRNDALGQPRIPKSHTGHDNGQFPEIIKVGVCLRQIPETSDLGPCQRRSSLDNGSLDQLVQSPQPLFFTSQTVEKGCGLVCPPGADLPRLPIPLNAFAVPFQQSL